MRFLILAGFIYTTIHPSFLFSQQARPLMIDAAQIQHQLKLLPNNTLLTPGQRWATVFMFVPVSVLMINNHEIGHTAVARLSGDESAQYYFYRSDPVKGSSLGYNIYDHTKLSQFGNSVVPLGGVLFSQSLAQAADLSLRKIPMTPFLQRTVAMTYVVAKFDWSFQVIQGLLKINKFDNIEKYGVPSKTDMVDFAYYASGGHHSEFIWINVGMVALTALDIYFSRHQIKRNWQMLFNKRRYKRIQ